MSKICTSIEQSKKLIELGIDVNTADMCWSLFTVITNGNKEIKHVLLPTSYEKITKQSAPDFIERHPAWSLSALENLMPFQIIENNERYGLKQWKGYNSQGETYCFEYVSNIATILYETYHRNNPLDAAFEMVCWLLENNKI